MHGALTADLDGFRHPFKLHSYSDLTEPDFKWAPSGILDLPAVALHCGRHVACRPLFCFRLLVLCVVAGSLSFTAWESLPK